MSIYRKFAREAPSDVTTNTVSRQIKPGGASRFLKMPLSELQDVNVSLDDLWGREGRDVRDRILEATTPERGISALSKIRKIRH